MSRKRFHRAARTKKMYQTTTPQPASSTPSRDDPSGAALILQIRERDARMLAWLLNAELRDRMPAALRQTRDQPSHTSSIPTRKRSLGLNRCCYHKGVSLLFMQHLISVLHLPPLFAGMASRCITLYWLLIFMLQTSSRLATYALSTYVWFLS
jgi:hypothetical protein